MKRPLLTFILIAVLQSTWIISEGASIKDFCTSPTVAENFDADWIHDNAKEGWHLSIGNMVARRHISQFLLGKNLTNSADYSDMCAKFHINIDHLDGKFDGTYTGYGTQSAEWNCNFVNEKFTCDYLSNSNQNYGDHGSAYVSYFDEREVKNLFVAVICFEDRDVAWYVASLTKTISKDEKSLIKEHLRSLGLDPNSVPLYYENCK